MVRSIVFPRVLGKSLPDLQPVLDLFRALGFAPGNEWHEGGNHGVEMLAPSGGVECIAAGEAPSVDVMVEVADADLAYEIVEKLTSTVATKIPTQAKPPWVGHPEPEINLGEETQSTKGSLSGAPSSSIPSTLSAKVADQDGAPVLVVRRKIGDTPYGARLFEVEVSGLRIGFITYANKAGETRGIEASLNAQGKRFAVVVSRFNSFITERLLDGALQALRQCGTNQDDITVVHVPGAFEIPAAARQLAESGKFSAVVCIGCLLRGGTLHYEVIANEVARGVGQSGQETGVPHSFGVLTCDTLEQAIDRAGLKAGNKGFEAALAAVEMASLRQRIAELPQPKHAEERSESSTSHSAVHDNTRHLPEAKR